MTASHLAPRPGGVRLLRRPIRERARFLTRLWLVSVPILLATYLVTPPSLWLLPEAVQDDPDSTSWGGKNVFDVHSKSQGTALDGTHYADW